MRLWLLSTRDDRPGRGARLTDPWLDEYDMNYGFVIRAKDPDEARGIASEAGGDENARRRVGEGSPWLNPELTSCVELTAEGEPKLIMSDYYSG